MITGQGGWKTRYIDIAYGHLKSLQDLVSSGRTCDEWRIAAWDLAAQVQVFSAFAVEAEAIVFLQLCEERIQDLKLRKRLFDAYLESKQWGLQTKSWKKKVYPLLNKLLAEFRLGNHDIPHLPDCIDDLMTRRHALAHFKGKPVGSGSPSFYLELREYPTPEQSLTEANPAYDVAKKSIAVLAAAHEVRKQADSAAFTSAIQNALGKEDGEGQPI